MTSESRLRSVKCVKSSGRRKLSHHLLAVGASSHKGKTQHKHTVGVHVSDIETPYTSTEFIGGAVGYESAHRGSKGGEVRARLNLAHHEGERGEVSLGPRLDTGLSFGRHWKLKVLGWGLEGGSDGFGLSLGLGSFKYKF
eukprot:TRINITY_DN956_c0_g1_i1.p1 TRINITY_DN956_c0_g1~~TRINITY_DN956_c0_g1_i1.p1  ORF type:complete len:156 (-),score=15.67 TRINITY_DN956_c0_g1_i1:73-492(-)